MKTYKVVLTPRAQASLRRITNYLQETASKEVATKVRKGILEAVKSLKALPNSHQAIDTTGITQTVYRRIIQWDYKIIFTVREEKVEVVVFEIYHSAQDPERLKNILK